MRTDPGLGAAWPSRWGIAVAMMVAALGPPAALACVGDCTGAGTVDIADLIVGVNIALGAAPVGDCPAFANPAGAVDIAQLVAGVNNALTGCADRRFVDNGDGTISDKQTGLMWEKKVGVDAGADPGNLHAADNMYLWAGECEFEGDACQPNEAAAAACMQDVEGDRSACVTCPPDNDLGLGSPCVGPYTTIWDWVAQVNASNFAGYADWRVPTVSEPQTIVDYTTQTPAVSAAFNGNECGPSCVDMTVPACSCTKSLPAESPYWSASADLTEFAPVYPWWFVGFSDGFVSYEAADGVGAPYVRAVRGATGATPVPRFVDNSDGTITDKQTNLIWEKKVGMDMVADATVLHDADNTYTWAGECSAATDILCQPNAAAAAACARGAQRVQTTCTVCELADGPCALDTCVTCQGAQGICEADPIGLGALSTVWDWLTQLNAANFAGHSDWRIPTEDELQSLVEYTVASPALDGVFNGVNCGGTCRDLADPACSCPAFGSWSSTTATECPSIVWVVDFSDGSNTNVFKFYDGEIRAVRGGSDRDASPNQAHRTNP